MQETLTIEPNPMVIVKLHLPWAFRCESLTLACLADVAVLILKLCVLKWQRSMCSSFKALLRAVLNDHHVSDLLLGSKNSGPGVPPCFSVICISVKDAQLSNAMCDKAGLLKGRSSQVMMW